MKATKRGPFRKNLPVRTICYDDGTRYVGSVIYGTLPHGKGAVLWASGERYEGEFHLGLRHGWGRSFWPDGSSYVGGFVEDNMEGHGVFRRASDKVYYEGLFKANFLQQGPGKKVFVKEKPRSLLLPRNVCDKGINNTQWSSTFPFQTVG